MKLRHDEKEQKLKMKKIESFPIKNKIVLLCSSALAFLTRSHFSACVNWNISRARVRRYYKIQKISARALNHLQKREDISTKREEEKVKIYTHAKEHYLLTLNMIILNISMYNINFLAITPQTFRMEGKKENAKNVNHVSILNSFFVVINLCNELKSSWSSKKFNGILQLQTFH